MLTGHRSMADAAKSNAMSRPSTCPRPETGAQCGSGMRRTTIWVARPGPFTASSTPRGVLLRHRDCNMLTCLPGRRVWTRSNAQPGVSRILARFCRASHQRSKSDPNLLARKSGRSTRWPGFLMLVHTSPCSVPVWRRFAPALPSSMPASQHQTGANVQAAEAAWRRSAD